MRAKRFLIVVLTLIIAWMGLGVQPAFAAYDNPYFIEIDITNQIVTVYNTDDKTVAMQSLCSTGTVGHETPKGTFYLPSKDREDERSEWYSFYALGVYAKWATRIINGYLFHSIPCRKKSLDSVVAKYVDQFGMPASHGCVRMRVEDAEFIAKNCLRGTRVDIFESHQLDEDLRSLLYISSFHESAGMTYQEFLGVSDTDLGRGSVGQEVMDLQYRLGDLGYYAGEFDGKYDVKTIGAVKHLQEDMGIAETGITSEDLKALIFSDDAPVAAGQVTITEGKSGPVVKKLQTALQQLGVYQGDLDSIFDIEVAEAIKMFQVACGYKQDGIASPEIQRAIYYQLDQLKEAFGEGSIPAVEMVTEETQLATVEAKANIKIRSEMDTESPELGKAYIGDQVTVIGVDGDWANIVSDGVVGYMYKKYLKDPQPQYNYILQYADDSRIYRIGRTIEEYIDGEDSVAEEMEDYFASEEFNGGISETVDYVTVNTGSDTVALNLRASASPEGDVLAAVPNGTELRVLSNEGDWTRVGYNESIGYLMSQYLTFWQGDSDELSAEGEYMSLDEMDSDIIAANLKAVAMTSEPDESGKRRKAYVYEEPKTKSDKITVLPDGAEIEVLRFCEEEGWVEIKYLAQTGFMREMNVKFQSEFEGA